MTFKHVICILSVSWPQTETQNLCCTTGTLRSTDADHSLNIWPVPFHLEFIWMLKSALHSLENNSHTHCMLCSPKSVGNSRDKQGLGLPIPLSITVCTNWMHRKCWGWIGLIWIYTCSSAACLLVAGCKNLETCLIIFRHVTFSYVSK